MSSSTQVLLDFSGAEAPKVSATSSFMDAMDTTFSYMDSGLDYLQYPPQSPSLMPSLPTGSPIAFNSSLTLSGDYTYSPSFSAASPERPYTPGEGAGIAPPDLYNLPAPDVSSEIVPSGRLSRSGTRSPAAVPYGASVPRSHRFNPLAIPPARAAVRAQRRRNSKSNDETDDDDEEFQPPLPPTNSSDARRETIRKQRIESEQRRRDELREGYSRLKDTLPPSNQKSSKVTLLDRAVSHIRYLETVKEQLEIRLKSAESEVHRLRSVNEALMLGTAGRHVANAAALVPQF